MTFPTVLVQGNLRRGSWHNAKIARLKDVDRAIANSEEPQRLTRVSAKVSRSSSYPVIKSSVPRRCAFVVLWK